VAKRIENTSLLFTEVIPGKKDLYLPEWFFLVSEVFRPQLDIERIERVIHKEKVLVETIGSPPNYAFREGHGCESRCGQWYVQVEKATAMSDGQPGIVHYQLYRRTPARTWEKTAITTRAMTQPQFVELLRLGPQQ
jgi:hypothetical protein